MSDDAPTAERRSLATVREPATAAASGSSSGMAAGVGKTYRMLLEGHAEPEAGRDVVIGFLETHGRARDRASWRRASRSSRAAASPTADTELEEMDLPAILARAPELCLIDELAHTNAAGRRARQALRGRRGRARRRDRRASRPSTSSTSRSLNDQVAELTGIRVRETIPDAVLGARRRGRADRPHAARR